jgi:hypothetical protein
MDELDRAIDIAAEHMMAREPSPALGYNVMARVREGDAHPSRPFLWMTAAAVFVLCAAIAMTLSSRAPAGEISLPPAAQLPIAQTSIARMPIAQSTSAPLPVARPARRSVALRNVRHAAALLLPPIDVSAIEPIETEPITLSAIDVPQLEGEVTLIETISIEPLTIEPLAASND